jgi:CheY-like chemotaxis protein
MKPKVLLVDDDADILDSYEDLLRRGGYTFGRARTRDDALHLAETEGPWDVALIDERLSGPAGPEGAASLVTELTHRAPEVCAIVITGYARVELVRAALAAGAWDYLQKDELVQLLLPQKVDQAVSVARARRLTWASGPDLERQLRATWDAARACVEPREKGRLLEETLRLLFRTLPGLDYVRSNWRNDAEELDLVVRNDSTDRQLGREGNLWLVECKNWTSKVDPREIDVLRAKLRNRYGRVRLGFLVATGGFTKNVAPTIQSQASEPELVVPIDGDQLAAWIAAPDRVGWLKDRLDAATMRTLD